MNKYLAVALPVLVIAAGGLGYGLLHWAKPEPQKSENGPRPVSVFVSPARTESVLLDVATGGEVRARTEVDLIAQVPGRVVSVSTEFTEGGTVRPNTILVTIEKTDYELALLQAEATVADARVDLEQSVATADVARRQLRDAENASDLALKKPQVEQARARVKAAEANLAQATVNLARTEITLPFAGRVTETYVDVGQYVTPGTRLGRAFATDVVEVRLPLNDAHLAALDLPIGYTAADRGLPVELTARVAGREQFWQAHLVRLDAAIERETRTLYGIAEVHAPYGENASQHGMPLAVGLYVNANILGRQIDGAVVIPRDALRAGNQVYVVNDDGRLEVREVSLHYTSAEQAVIKAGIAPRERVVVSSIRNPIEGMALAPLQQDARETAVSARDSVNQKAGS